MGFGGIRYNDTSVGQLEEGWAGGIGTCVLRLVSLTRTRVRHLARERYQISGTPCETLCTDSDSPKSPCHVHRD